MTTKGVTLREIGLAILLNLVAAGVQVLVGDNRVYWGTFIFVFCATLIYGVCVHFVHTRHAKQLECEIQTLREQKKEFENLRLTVSDTLAKNEQLQRTLDDANKSREVCESANRNLVTENASLKQRILEHKRIIQRQNQSIQGLNASFTEALPPEMG